MGKLEQGGLPHNEEERGITEEPEELSRPETNEREKNSTLEKVLKVMGPALLVGLAGFHAGEYVKERQVSEQEKGRPGFEEGLEAGEVGVDVGVGE